MAEGPVELDGNARERLLASARSAVERHARGWPPVPAPREPAALRQRRGVFVTITRRGRLRGCIGFPLPRRELGEAVMECAVAAASQDPRFPAVGWEELDELRFEISVLSVPRATTPQEVEVGLHGLIVSQGELSGLLLPQVASERGWDRETFLCETCLKAGLEPDAWRRDARLESFEAEVFGEGPRGPGEERPG